MAINYVDNTKRFLVGQLKRPGLYLVLVWSCSSVLAAISFMTLLLWLVFLFCLTSTKRGALMKTYGGIGGIRNLLVHSHPLCLVIKQATEVLLHEL